MAIKLDNACNVSFIVNMDKTFYLEHMYKGQAKVTPMGVACK